MDNSPQLIIVAIGCYAGVILKKKPGYCFAFTFLLFALFDYLSSIGFSPDLLAVLNIIAVLAATGGITLMTVKV